MSYNGFAYVADRSAGLQVINYQPSDNKNVPPGVTLAPGFSLTSSGGYELIENTRATVAARASDDVLVRNVEFYLDGSWVQSDGSFPFEIAFNVPLLAPNKTSFTLQARAIDTGGNSAWSQTITVSLRPDVAGPEVSRILPARVAAGFRRVSVLFSEAIDPASLNERALQVWAAGADGLPGTPDDIVLAGGSATLPGARTAVLEFGNNLALGSYRIVVNTNFTDLKGNHLAAPVTHDFRVIDAVYWTGPAVGNWQDAFNWSAQRVPGTNDDVVIAGEFPAVVTLSQGESTIRNLLSEDRLILAGGRLTVTGELQAADLELRGGTLASSRVGAEVKRFRAISGTFDNVTFDADFTLENGDQIRVVNGLTINRKLTLTSMGNFTGLSLYGAQTLRGAGELVFAGTGAGNFVSPYADLLISPGFTIRGGQGSIGEQGITLTNQGRIIAEEPGKALRIQGKSFLNEGTIEARDGGIIALAGDWANQGTLKIANGTMDLLGNFSTAGLGKIERTGGTISLQGILNNTNSTFTLTPALGNWLLEGGTIQSGRVRTEGGAGLRLKSGALDGVVLDSDFTLQNSDQIRVLHGLTVNGKLSLISGGNFTGIYFVGPQFLGGTGELFLEGAAGGSFLSPTGLLTIGPGFLIHGNGTIGEPGVPLVNEGTIRAEANGRSIRVSGKPFTNKGTVEATAGATIALLSEWTNEGVLKLTAGDLVFGGNFSTAGLGTIQNNGGTNRLQGVLNNTGTTLTVDASWVLEGGTIQGGSMVAAGPGFRFKSGKLDGVTLDSDFTLEDSDQIQSMNGMTVNKKLTIASVTRFSGIYFQGQQVLGGSGELIFAGTGNGDFVSPNARLTIGPGFVVRGRTGAMGEPGIPLTNEGSIIAEVSGQTLRIQGLPLLNKGTIEARNGGGITLNGQWANEGLLKVTDSSLNLAGSSSTASLGTFQRVGGTINLQAILHNTNSILALNATFGDWILDGGTIVGGTVTAGNGGSLRLKSGFLDGVTLNSDFVMENSDQIRVLNGLTVNNRLTLTSTGNFTGIYFQGAQTLGGVGDVLFAGPSNGNFISPNGTLTIGPGVTIHGRNGTLGEGAVPLINQGKILADVADGTITVRGTPFTNTGTTNSLNGGKLLINP